MVGQLRSADTRDHLHTGLAAASAGPVHFAEIRCCEEGTLPTTGETKMSRVTSQQGSKSKTCGSRPFLLPWEGRQPQGSRMCPSAAAGPCRRGPHRSLCPAGLPRVCAVWRVPGGPVVGRSVPHPLRTRPGPQEGPSTQAAVASVGQVDQLERQRWQLRLG